MVGGIGDLATSSYAIARAVQDASLFELAEELIAADHILQAAATKLACAERKLDRAVLEDRELPTWFLAREEDEASARTVVESLYEQIAETRAHTKAGLAIKLKLLGALYCNDPTAAQDDCDVDVPSRLLRSMIEDVLPPLCS
ncbi:hypothetical protein [Reyranella soli]|uniref:Uncharacterized protein n=1 Tax=Reyranella soli TaxID=1230389 RepID=A0A512NRS7_9HYPH|nr:hypothetical protein [Reyranella soli]GEP61651.1 hypothetical protein RSO01_88170 [Reyranella soli]